MKNIFQIIYTQYAQKANDANCRAELNVHVVSIRSIQVHFGPFRSIQSLTWTWSRHYNQFTPPPATTENSSQIQFHTEMI